MQRGGRGMYAHIALINDRQLAERSTNYLEALGHLYQIIENGDSWIKIVDAIHVEREQRRLDLALSSSSLTPEQVIWLDHQQLIGSWWFSYDQEGMERILLW